MATEEKNRHSLSIWETTKDEAGLVAAGAILGGAVGVGGGYIVSQVAGTPLTPSLLVGGGVGVIVGGGTAIYASHRIKEARAEAAAYADDAIAEAVKKVRTGRPLVPSSRGEANMQALLKEAMSESLEGVNTTLASMPELFSEALGDKLEQMIPAHMAQ